MMMMMMMILPPVLLGFFYTTVASLQCYSCSVPLGQHYRCENLSLSDPTDDIPPMGLGNGGTQILYDTCIYSDSVCAKYIVEYGDSLMIHRSCQHRDICNILASRYNNYYSNLIECHTCYDANYCNSSQNMQMLPVFPIILLIILQFC